MDSSQVLFSLLLLASSLLFLVIGVLLHSLARKMFKGSNPATIGEDIVRFHNQLKRAKGRSNSDEVYLTWSEQPEYRYRYNISRICFFFFWLLLAAAIIQYGQERYDQGFTLAVYLLGILEFYYIIGILRSYSLALEAFQTPKGTPRKEALRNYKKRFRQADKANGKEKGAQLAQLRNEQILYCYYQKLADKYAVKATIVFFPLIIGLSYAI